MDLTRTRVYFADSDGTFHTYGSIRRRQKGFHIAASIQYAHSANRDAPPGPARRICANALAITTD